MTRIGQGLLFFHYVPEEAGSGLATEIVQKKLRQIVDTANVKRAVLTQRFTFS